MPNTTPESALLVQVKALIAQLSAGERARLRPWLLARYDVQGNEQAPMSASKP